MGEKRSEVLWYRLRGLGLVSLCSLVFFAGAWISSRKSLPASSMSGGVRMVVHCAQNSGKQISLTFETAGGNRQIPEILGILDTYQAHATFFVTGSWVQNYPEDVERIAAAGHELANHSEHYRDMTAMTQTAMKEELMTLHARVQALTGAQMQLFRAPYGRYSDELLETAGISGYTAVAWDVDTEDWKDYGVSPLIAAVTKSGNLKGGSIIRMHSDAKYTADALEAVAADLTAQGYEFVTVSELLAE